MLFIYIASDDSLTSNEKQIKYKWEQVVIDLEYLEYIWIISNRKMIGMVIV